MELGELVTALTIVVELEVVHRLKLELVRDGEHRDAHLSATVIEIRLDVRLDAIGALIEHGILRRMVKETSERHALLLSRREVRLPIENRVHRGSLVVH